MSMAHSQSDELQKNVGGGGLMQGYAEEFDVIVVGSGISGGLSAAAYLQKSGCSVAVIERDKRGAPFSSFYERSPGVRFDVAPVNFSVTQPRIRSVWAFQEGSSSGWSIR